jgi:hypothetical protein
VTEAVPPAADAAVAGGPPPPPEVVAVEADVVAVDCPDGAVVGVTALFLLEVPQPARSRATQTAPTSA